MRFPSYHLNSTVGPSNIVFAFTHDMILTILSRCVYTQ
jgi:hypothetical protein